jgi:hypothetical protein
MSKGAIELGEFERRESGNEVSQLAFKHQRQKITANGAGAWQTVLWTEDDFCAESENFAINRGTYHRRNTLVLRDKGSGYNDVKSRLSSALCYPFAGAVNLPSPHERTCSEMSARACRARRLRCLRKTSPSFAAIAWRRCRSAYWRTAVRTSAEGLGRRGEVWVNSSRSLEVASSIAIVFMRRIIAAVLDCAQVQVLIT